MLILSRKKNESIMIGNDIEIQIVGIENEQVKIGIKAPKSLTIYRQELFMAIQEENRKALSSNIESIKKELLGELEGFKQEKKKK